MKLNSLGASVLALARRLIGAPPTSAPITYSLNRRVRERSSTTSAAHRGRGLWHITSRYVGIIVVALGTALTGVAIIAPRASAATACIYQTFGESGTHQSCVLDEQVLLNDLRYDHVAGPNQLLTVDGYYGTHTFSDVESFQTAWNLDVDGITGPQTWGQLCEVDYVHGFTGTYFQDAGCRPRRP